MKKIFLILVLCTFLITGFFTCVLYKWTVHRDWPGNVSIRINESADSYQLAASYSRSKALRIQNYIDAELNTHHLFRNSRIDAEITLDDRTNMYVKNIPGKLLIKLNRNQNSAEAYARIKKLAEGIKITLTEN